jgi:hypothetical protein
MIRRVFLTLRLYAIASLASAAGVLAAEIVVISDTPVATEALDITIAPSLLATADEVTE